MGSINVSGIRQEKGLIHFTDIIVTFEESDGIKTLSFKDHYKDVMLEIAVEKGSKAEQMLEEIVKGATP